MSANNTSATNRSGSKARLIFGIFMVIVYLAVGVLCIIDFFNFGNPTISLCLGILLAVYGLWRGYRLFKGMP